MSRAATLARKFGISLKDDVQAKQLPAPIEPSIIEMMEWLASQGEFRVSKFDGWGNNGKVYAMVELNNNHMKLRLDSDTVSAVPGAIEVVVTQIYERVKASQERYGR